MASSKSRLRMADERLCASRAIHASVFCSMASADNTLMLIPNAFGQQCALDGALCCCHCKQMTPYQEGGHAKQQHVYKVRGAKLEGDLLQLGAILYAAWFPQPDQIPAIWSSSAGKCKQRVLLGRRVRFSAHIHSTLSRKGKDGFPRKMKQVISLQICMAGEYFLQRHALQLPAVKCEWSQVRECINFDHGCHLELSHYQRP